ncbi:BREX-1 system adenine-specific DNA-methyltransferase PglX [Aeromonas veronii]
MSLQENNNMRNHFYRASAADFGKIPGNPVAYWATDSQIRMFETCPRLSDVASIAEGTTTGDVNRFLKMWHEISSLTIGFDFKNSQLAESSGFKWFPYNKGGEYRKWYGNNDFLVNWEGNGQALKSYGGSFVRGEKYYFLPGVTWSKVSSSALSFRFFNEGFLFDTGGLCLFSKEINYCLSILNSKASLAIMKLLAPTLNFTVGTVSSIPIHQSVVGVERLSLKLIEQSKSDWDSYEVSWDFSNFPLLHLSDSQPLINASYQNLRTRWHETTLEMQHLEEENNRLFIEAYGLQDELTPDVPLSEITLTCNPHYRYGSNLTDEEREARLQSDTIAELISYAIGCMMGRYSLDREGLVYAHTGNEGFKALVEEGAYATFAADEDGILPLSTDSWFEDDVATRLEAFVCTVWGAETLEENLQFIADSLCLAAIKPVKKGGETARETIRRYLSTQFFKDHLKTYKKRPIYWLFSSGKEKAFECLVYLHRYNEATLPRMRTEYVTPLLGQMAGRIDRLRLQQAEAGTAEAKRIGKDIDSLTKQLTELRAFDDELKHHADMRITLDLDDGVKVNYGKFGTLLSEVKAITGDKGE